MQLISINIGQAQTIANAKSSGTTGIYKRPVEGPVQITAEGLPGDAICDTKNHGGPDQAVYLFSSEDYAWWSSELGSELEPGTFGENLTIRGFESAELAIGDRFHIGPEEQTVVLEVTAPRIPCVTLAARMGDPTFVKRFRHAERPGLYCRVIQEGTVQAGDPVRLEPYCGNSSSGDRVAAIDMFRDFYTGQWTEAALRRYLAAPIAIRDRVEKEEKLAELLEGKIAK